MHDGGMICAGLCFICAHKTGPGRFITSIMDKSCWRRSIHGRQQRETLLPRSSAKLISRSKQRAKARAARWRKLVWNVPFNGLSVLYDQLTDALLDNYEGEVLACMQEVQRAAAADGTDIDNEFIAGMLANTRRMTPYAPSMLLDYRAGREMEIAAIYDAFLNCAAEHGIACPTATMVRDRLRDKQAQLDVL